MPEIACDCFCIHQKDGQCEMESDQTLGMPKCPKRRHHQHPGQD